MFWLHNPCFAWRWNRLSILLILRHRPICKILHVFKLAWFDVVFKYTGLDGCYSLKRWEMAKNFVKFTFTLLFLCSSFPPTRQQCQACLHCFHIQGPSVHCKAPSSQRLDLNSHYAFTSCGNVDKTVFDLSRMTNRECGWFKITRLGCQKIFVKYGP